MKSIRKKGRRIIYIFLKFKGIQVVLSLIMLIIIIKTIFDKQGSEGLIDVIDVSFFSAIVFAAVLEVLGHGLSIFFMNKIEDAIKLTVDYDALSKRYCNVKLYSFCNNKINNNTKEAKKNYKKLRRLYKKQYRDVKSSVCLSDIFKFPITDVIDIAKCRIYVDDNKTNMYKLPEDVRENYSEIMQAHKTSNIYNQLNIRVDDWKKEGEIFTLKTSRTTYFDSMVTNRAMDFRWSDGTTVREKYEYPPLWNSLEKSLLSNHLGFNGFVESSDGYVVFVKRNKGLSIGKKTYGNSVGASLKTKYALNTEGQFDVEGLNKAILCEIKDELNIEKDNLVESSLKNNILYAYRDMVEGGKPQLLFYVVSKKTKKDIENEFKSNSKNNKRLIDGKKLLWIKKEELYDVCVTAERIIYKGKSYKMVPSASACVGMLIDYYKREEEN